MLIEWKNFFQYSVKDTKTHFDIYLAVKYHRDSQSKILHDDDDINSISINIHTINLNLTFSLNLNLNHKLCFRTWKSDFWFS